MKKNIVLSILAVAVIAAIGLFAVKNKGSIFSVKGKKAASQASSAAVSIKDVSLLPEDTDVCIVLGDLGTVSSNIKNSAFGQEFASLPVWNFLDIEKNLKELTGALGESFGGEVNKEQILSLLSKKVTVGIDVKGDAPVITMLAQADSGAIAEIKRILSSPNNKSNLSVEKYQDIEINFITAPTPDQPTTSYIVFDNSIVCMILGGTIDDAKAMVERKSGLKKSLVANKVVQDVLNKDFSDQGFFFLSLEKMTTAPVDAAMSLTAVSGDMLKHIVGGISFVDGANLNFKIYPDKDKMTDAIRDMWFVEPKKLSVIKYAPAGSLFFTGSTQMNFNQLFTGWKENLAAQNTELTKGFLENLEGLKEKQNINIEGEVIPNIGNEMGVICSAIEAKGLMPLIEINLVIEVLNKNIINKNLEEAVKALQAGFAQKAQAEGADTTAPTFTIESTEYGDIEIKQIKLPFMLGQALSPCYAFVDKYLVISSSVTGMQKIIDVRGGKINSLSGSDSFGKVKDILPETTNQMGFVDIVKVLDSAVSLSEWIVSFQRLSIPQGDTPEAIAQRQEAQQTEQLIRDNLIPLLKSLRVVKCLGVNTINQGNGKYVDQAFQLVIEDKVKAA